MKGAWLTASVPFVGALLAFAVLKRVHGELVEDSLYFIVGILVLGAAALGSLVAALAYDPGDYLRRAWTLMGWCFGLLVLNTLLFRSYGHAQVRTLSMGAAFMSGALLVVANVSNALGILRVAGAWRVAGLDLRVLPAVRWGATLTTLAIAIALVGGTLSRSVQNVVAQNWGSLPSIASDLGTLAILAVVAPILLTALALRGGSLGWPWMMLGLSGLGWLFYSASSVLGPVLGVDPATARPFEAALRVFACVSQLSAGLLQASVLAESEQPLPLPAAAGRR
jgi:hypothetical protein